MVNNMNKKKLILLTCVFFLSASLFSQTAVTVINEQNVQIEYSPLNDSVFLYYLDSRGKKTPVIDLVEYAYSTFVGVLIDGKYYNIKQSSGIDTKVNVEENTLVVQNVIANKVSVDIYYKIKKNNVLSLTYKVTNIDKKTHTVSIKSVFDTILGERRGGSYTTAVKSSIDSEYIISDLKKHKRLISTDGKIGISFILDDKIQKDVYKVVIAAKPFFHTDGFENQFVEGRGFNTILSYNNSSVGFFYKQKTLSAKASVSYEQNIIFSGDVVKLYKNLSSAESSYNQEDFFEDDNESINETSEEEKSIQEGSVQNENDFFEEDFSNEKKLSNNDSDNSFEMKDTYNPSNSDDEISVEEKKLEQVKPESVEKQTEVKSQEQINQPKAELKPEVVSPVVENPTQIQPEVQKPKIDKEYALKIIERIQQIENDGSNTNRYEIIKLQTELNLILKQLED